MDRRQALQAAASCLGGGVSLGGAARNGAWLATVALPACDAPDQAASTALVRQPSWFLSLFSPEQALCIEDLTEHLIPEGATPGARRAGVPAFIESILKDVYDESDKAAFLASLDALTASAQAQHAAPFFRCTSEQQRVLIDALVARARDEGKEKSRFSFFAELRELTIRGFCTSKLGATRVLEYEPTPGEYQGCAELSSVGKASATW